LLPHVDPKIATQFSPASVARLLKRMTAIDELATQLKCKARQTNRLAAQPLACSLSLIFSRHDLAAFEFDHSQKIIAYLRNFLLDTNRPL
jgi:hypothetical protein